ncbi:MAG: response regulator [Nitrospirae bacterium]|nr:response regulator [Nitrospirota bacterium]
MATILVVDAQEDFREVLRSVLVAYGHEVVTATTGQEALQLLEDRRPAVVLLDPALPGTHGLDLLVALRGRAPQIPVVVVSEGLSTEVESRAREIGVADVVRKGLKMDVIMETVHHALQHAGKPAEGRPAAPVPEGGVRGAKAATILIVDDEPEIVELVGEFLERRGYRVKTAINGEDALALVEKKPPDLMLLDIYMPGMNGVDVLRRLKAQQSPVGVIMLTASQEERLLQEVLDLGAFDVLSKPVNLDQIELAVMVKLLLSAKE